MADNMKRRTFLKSVIAAAASVYAGDMSVATVSSPGAVMDGDFTITDLGFAPALDTGGSQYMAKHIEIKHKAGVLAMILIDRERLMACPKSYGIVEAEIEMEKRGILFHIEQGRNHG